MFYKLLNCWSILNVKLPNLPEIKAMPNFAVGLFISISLARFSLNCFLASVAWLL